MRLRHQALRGYPHLVSRIKCLGTGTNRIVFTWAQLFEGRLALHLGFFLLFKSIFSDNFLRYF